MSGVQCDYNPLVISMWSLEHELCPGSCRYVPEKALAIVVFVANLATLVSNLVTYAVTHRFQLLLHGVVRGRQHAEYRHHSGFCVF